MENKNTVGAQFKSMKILHGAMCIGLIIILTVLRYLIKKENNITIQENTIIDIIGIIMGFIGVLSSRFIFFTRTRVAQTIPSIANKISIYRSVLILQMAILEGAAIGNVILYIITKNNLHFLMAIGLLLFMIFGRPTRTMASMLLFNKKENKQLIYNDNLLL